MKKYLSSVALVLSLSCILLIGCEKETPLEGAAALEVTTSLVPAVTAEFQLISDHSSKDYNEWTDYALITGLREDGTAAWRIQTDTVMGWTEGAGPYIAYGSDEGLLIYIKINHDYSHTINAVSIASGEKLWETNVIDTPVSGTANSLKISKNKELFIITPSGDLLGITKNGQIYEDFGRFMCCDGNTSTPVIIRTEELEGGCCISHYCMRCGEAEFHLQWDEQFDNIEEPQKDFITGDWREIYAAFIAAQQNDGIQNSRIYHLAFIDEDAIPELLVYNKLSKVVLGYTILDNGEMNGPHWYSNTYPAEKLSYIEQGNSLFLQAGNDQYKLYFICSVSAKKSVGEEYTLDNVSYTYIWPDSQGNDAEVTRESFNKRLENAFDMSKATTIQLQDGYTADEILMELAF